MEKINVTAIMLGQRLRLKNTNSKFAFENISEDSHIILFEYGAIVFWNLSEDEIQNYIKKNKEIIEKPLKTPIQEITTVVVGKEPYKLENNEIYLKELNKEIIHIISVSLCRSVALEFHEIEVDNIYKEFNKVATALENGSINRLKTKKLLSTVWKLNNIKHSTITKIEFLDKPALTWDYNYLDSLFEKIELDLELKNRYEIMKEKSEIIEDNVSFIFEIINVRKSILLEITIVLLIVIEILIFIYELFFMK